MSGNGDSEEGHVPWRNWTVGSLGRPAAQSLCELTSFCSPGPLSAALAQQRPGRREGHPDPFQHTLGAQPLYSPDLPRGGRYDAQNLLGHAAKLRGWAEGQSWLMVKGKVLGCWAGRGEAGCAGWASR